MKRYLLIILFFWASLGFAITVEVNPHQVQLGESFRLTLTLDAAQGGIPDLTPLEHDFTIQGTERSMSYTAVNGQARSISQWSVILTAKKTGVLPIPAIKIGQQASSPTQITVVAGAVNSASHSGRSSTSTKDVMLTAEISNSSAYLNEQIIYTVKLFNRLQLLNAEYQPPRVENALLVPLGDGRHTQTVLNGNTYEVDEQQYAIFPQKSGPLTITPPNFRALIYGFEPKRIYLEAKPKKIEIKSVPKQIKMTNWFPAKQVKIAEHYEQNVSALNQGDTITRTIELAATGVPAQLLPVLKFDHNAKQYSVYPEKQESKNLIKHHELVGKATVKVTYLLNKAGRITIPSLNIPWFNTITGQEEQAVLPERVFEVASSSVTPASQANLAENQPTSTLITPNQDDMRANQSTNYWLWLTIGFAAAWILTLLLWWYKPRLLKHRYNRRSAAIKRLQQACKTNDPIEVCSALLSWAAVQWPNAAILNLNDITRLVHDTEFKKQIHLLSLHLYSQNNKTIWKADSLWQCIVAYKSKKPGFKKNKRKEELPPINPVH